MGDLTGKTAIITGSGRGLGRETALQLASQGANIVINDIDLPDAKEAAIQTVEDIKATGAEAILVLGDCADTADSDKLFETAVSTFGDVNIVVNNAGFCRDKTIFGMSDDEFDSVVRVHLRGHFVNMRNATKHWRAKNKAGEENIYGRLISTASEAALFCDPGQPNYAAAKAGIVAMTMSAAQLMRKAYPNVTCNVVMPRARTDMTKVGITAEIFAEPEEGFDYFGPQNVAPLMGYLASPETAHISGETFVVHGNQVYVVQRANLSVKYENPKGKETWTVDGLGDTLSDYFNDDHKKVWDGFSVPPQ